MTVPTAPLFPDRPLEGGPLPEPDAGLGALRTEHGNLPLEWVRISASIAGLAAGIEVVEGFRNPFDVPLEATYIFPLPDRAALTAMRMEAADRVIEGTLKERGQARADYDAAMATGRRAAIAEEDRPDVFTMRVGNILPGERVTVTLRLSQPLPYEDGAATFRFPLVVAPRYIPGTPLDGPAAGDGVEPDTDAVPDASRITPPVLLPGFPDPVRLEPDGLEVVPDTVSPSRLGALFPGIPLVISGRWRGEPSGAMTLRGVSTGDGSPWGRSASAQVLDDPAAVHIWARSHLRELEDRYVTSGSTGLESRIVETSLRFGVLCRFTAFVAVDTRVVAAGQDPHRVVQPVELPDGWTGAAPGDLIAGGGVASALGGGYGAAMPPPMGAATAPRGQGGAAPSPPATPAVVRGATPRLRAPIRPSVGGAPASASGGAPPQDVRAVARTQLRQEVDYLATQRTAPDDIRSRLLSDLRTRLEALIVHLQDSAVPEDELAPLIALVAELDASEEPLWGARLWVLWDRTLRVLTEVAAEKMPEKTPEKTREKAPFWKRRP